MPSPQYIYIVMTTNIVFDAYYDPNLAHAHARTITGAVVVPCGLLTTLPNEVREDLYVDEYDESEDTPQVVHIPFDDIIK